MLGFTRGVLKIKCINPGGYILTGYGQYQFNENEEVDLLDINLPDTIRCDDWWTADNICRDPGCEIAQLIAAGHFVITENSRPQQIRS